MAKFLLLIAVFTVVYLVFRSFRGKQDRSSPGPSHAASSGGHGEDMVRCRVCGVHLPRSEALTSRGEMFCSREHLQLADREGRGD